MRGHVLLGALLVATAAACGARSSVLDAQGTTGPGASGSGASTSTGDVGASSSSTSSSSASSGGTGGAPACATDDDCACIGICCSGRCVNNLNDILHCGQCDTPCGGPSPYCDMGVCAPPPCDAGTTCGVGSTCCGTGCCAPGELCCTTHAACCDFTSCQAPSHEGTCDVGAPCTRCASPDTPIATPDGERAIASIRVGDLVYSAQDDAVVVVPVRAVSRNEASHHRVVALALANGAVLRISPLHPTADGRTFGDLAAGGQLDGIGILRAELVPYGDAFTYDILPASRTGAYFAGGALIGSTLAR